MGATLGFSLRTLPKSLLEEHHLLPFPHTRMLPLESPVMVSPFSEKVTQRTNFGFSCFCRMFKKEYICM